MLYPRLRARDDPRHPRRDSSPTQAKSGSMTRLQPRFASPLRTLLIWLLVLLCAAAPVYGQNVDLRQDLARAQPQIGFTRTAPEDQPTFLPDESYLLGAGDQIQVLI